MHSIVIRAATGAALFVGACLLLVPGKAGAVDEVVVTGARYNPCFAFVFWNSNVCMGDELQWPFISVVPQIITFPGSTSSSTPPSPPTWINSNGHCINPRVETQAGKDSVSGHEGDDDAVAAMTQNYYGTTLKNTDGYVPATTKTINGVKITSVSSGSGATFYGVDAAQHWNTDLTRWGLPQETRLRLEPYFKRSYPLPPGAYGNHTAVIVPGLTGDTALQALIRMKNDLAPGSLITAAEGAMMFNGVFADNIATLSSWFTRDTSYQLAQLPTSIQTAVMDYAFRFSPWSITSPGQNDKLGQDIRDALKTKNWTNLIDTLKNSGNPRLADLASAIDKERKEKGTVPPDGVAPCATR